MKKVNRLQNNNQFKLFKNFQQQGYVHIFVANIISRLSTAGFPFLIAFFMTSYEVGAVKIFLSYMSLFVLLSGLGLESGIVRFCSTKKNEKQRENLFDILLAIGIIFSVIITIIVATLSYFEVFSPDKIINNLIFTGIFCLPFLIILSYSNYYLQAQRKFKSLAKLNVILSIIGLIFLLVMALVFYLNGFIIGYIISNLIMSITVFAFARKNINKKLFKSLSIKIKNIKNVLKFSIYSLLANSVGQINYTLDIIMLSILGVSVSEIGYYSIAQILIFGLRQFIMAANQITVPSLSKNFIENKKSAKKQFKKHQSFTTLMASLVLVGGIIAIPLIIKWIMPQYYSSVPVFIVLLFGLFFWSQYSVKGITLLAAGRSDINLYVSLSSLIINLTLNLILINMFGIVGAAIAITLTYLITWIIMSVVFSKLNLFKNNLRGTKQ